MVTSKEATMPAITPPVFYGSGRRPPLTQSSSAVPALSRFAALPPHPPLAGDPAIAPRSGPSGVSQQDRHDTSATQFHSTKDKRDSPTPHPCRNEPHGVYLARYPGPWNSPMRTPFTKRVDANHRVYLTDSPGNVIQEATQPFPVGKDPDTVSNAEWLLLKGLNLRGPHHQARRKRVSTNPHYADCNSPDNEHGGRPDESDASASDTDYVPNSERSAQSKARDDHSSAHEQSLSPPPFTAKQKGKGPAVHKDQVHTQRQLAVGLETLLSETEDLAESMEDGSRSARGRPNQAVVALFREFGESTRHTAQALASDTGFNLATVMRHAGFGAAQATRAPSDYNTFKKLWSAQVLAATSGMLVPNSSIIHKSSCCV